MLPYLEKKIVLLSQNLQLYTYKFCYVIKSLIYITKH